MLSLFAMFFFAENDQCLQNKCYYLKGHCTIPCTCSFVMVARCPPRLIQALLAACQY